MLVETFSLLAEGVNVSAMPQDNTAIAVYPADSYAKNRRLLEALQALYFVRFAPCDKKELNAFKFALLLEATAEHISDAQQLGSRCFVCPAQTQQEAGCGREAIQFADVSYVDESFRGGNFHEETANDVALLYQQPDDLVLGHKNGSTFWLRRTAGISVMDWVAVKPKVIATDEILREHFGKHSLSHIVPLLHFIREVAGEEATPAAAPKNACIVIDDPSLYTTSYGYINFKKLAKHAKLHGYHVAIATIALDTWKISPKVASLFKQYADHLSLIIHGNNHTYLEVVSDRSPAHLLTLAAQALRRFKRCERQKLAFSPIMEAPYGTFVSEFAEPLVNLGYEAALCAPAQFVQQNRGQGISAAFGCGPADVLPHGLCAIPRLVMSEDWHTEIAVAAFLRQPMVLACHHQDFADGLDLLADLTAYINRLGNVKWSSLAEIAKESVVLSQKKSTLVINLGARRVECRIPSGVEHIVIERPWVGEAVEQLILKDATGARAPLHLRAGSVSHPLPWQGDSNAVLLIESPVSSAIDPNAVAPPARSLWPFARKMAIEVRDRAYPLIPAAVLRYLGKRSKKKNPVLVRRSPQSQETYVSP